MRTLEDLEIYQLSMSISDKIWNEVIAWNYFEKNSIGMQLVRAADSISANIAEGYGRESNAERKRFCYYSRGSLKEISCFLEKSYSRKLIDEEFHNSIKDEVNILGRKLNNFIKYLH